MRTLRRRRRLKKVRMRGREKRSRRCHQCGRKADQQGRTRRGETVGLPSEVVELIIERLPTLSLLRFTTVCKRWRDAIVARLVDPRRYGVEEDWLVMISDGRHLGKLSAYNPAREEWHCIELIPGDTVRLFPFAVAAGGNFVCVSNRCYRKFGTYGRVAVCDPLLKRHWHELPPLRSWGVIQGVVVDPATRGVKILVTNFLGSDDGATFKLTCAELYDSSTASTGRWKMALPPTPLLAADCCAVVCDARFVFLAPDYSLFAFDVSSESWIRVPTGGPLPETAPRRTVALQAHTKLVVIDDSIFLFTIEVFDSDDPATSRNLVVWGLTAAMDQWVEVAKAPPSVTSQFLDNPDVVEEFDALNPTMDSDASAESQNHGSYSSLQHWTVSPREAHNDEFRVWAVAVGKSTIFLKNALLPQLLQLDLSKAGDARWRWVVCPHHVPLSARPFRVAL